MATNNDQALNELCQNLVNEGIINFSLFNIMVQVQDGFDALISEYCKKANNILSFAKTELELQEPRYPLIDNMLDKLEIHSHRVGAKKVFMSVIHVRLCLTGDPEDLDVVKSALGTLEQDQQEFESQLQSFIELKKQVYLDAPQRSQE